MDSRAPPSLFDLVKVKNIAFNSLNLFLAEFFPNSANSVLESLEFSNDGDVNRIVTYADEFIYQLPSTFKTLKLNAPHLSFNNFSFKGNSNFNLFFGGHEFNCFPNLTDVFSSETTY
jgi:catalase